MEQKIDFLRILDQPIAKVRAKSEFRPQPAVPSLTPIVGARRRNPNLQRFQYAKGIQFGEEKLGLFPGWLKSRNDFVEFVYRNYEKKILQLPKICQKPAQQRASDQLYFLSQYLSQFSIFNKLPSAIEEILLKQLKVRFYRKGDCIHDSEQSQCDFMAIIFLGEIEYEAEGKLVKKQKNELIMNECFYKPYHPTITAKEQTILFVLERSVYQEIKQKLTADLSDTYKQDMTDMSKSDFFSELHIKDKRCRNFIGDLSVEFYFKGEVIYQCGDQPQKFFLLLNGQILRKNHIHIREHNKWPLPNGRWEIRAVYKTYESDNELKKFDFFGDEQIIGGNKMKSTYYAKSHCLLMGMNRQSFNRHISSQDQKKLKKYRNEHMTINYQDFEKDVRRKRRQTDYKKRIVHQAIDVSFSNRSTLPQLQRTRRKVQGYERHMLSHLDDIVG